jgi:flagellar basal-body rod modification protein FlgD
MTTPISSIVANASPSGPPDPTATSTATPIDRTQLSSRAFLQLLIAQLQYQDPTKPVDTSALMSQTATLNQIQTMQQLSVASTAQTLAQQQQTATNMVGHNVSYTDSAGATVTGYVSAATLTGPSPTLTVGDQTVALAQIKQVLASTASTPAPTP